MQDAPSPYAKIFMDPATCAIFDEISSLLVDAGIIDGMTGVEERQADTFEEVLRASRAVPLRLRWRYVVRAPIRVWRVRRAIRPWRDRIRESLPLPVHERPWIEQDETMRRILHGI